MKTLFSLMILMLLAVTTDAEARIKVKGRGPALNFDPVSIPENFQPSFEMMTKKCTKCHTMERVVIAVQTGRAPITGQTFDRQSIKAYGIKMLRKPNSDMNKKDIKDIVLLLNYILDQTK